MLLARRAGMSDGAVLSAAAVPLGNAKQTGDLRQALLMNMTAD